jgi:hypothetical protein
MNNNMVGVGWTVVHVFEQIISFLGLGLAIAGLVICIMNRRLSKSMILCIVGFAGQIGVWVLQNLAGALGGLGSLGQEAVLALAFFRVLIGLLGPVSTVLLIFGLYRVFTEARERLGIAGSGGTATRRRRYEDEEEDELAPRPKKPGSRDIQR